MGLGGILGLLSFIWIRTKVGNIGRLHKEGGINNNLFQKANKAVHISFILCQAGVDCSGSALQVEVVVDVGESGTKDVNVDSATRQLMQSRCKLVSQRLCRSVRGIYVARKGEQMIRDTGEITEQPSPHAGCVSNHGEVLSSLPLLLPEQVILVADGSAIGHELVHGLAVEALASLAEGGEEGAAEVGG